MTSLPPILIRLSSTRLELAVQRKGIIEAIRDDRFDPPAPGTDLAEQLSKRHSTLKSWITELALAGKPAALLYAGPTASTLLTSLPVTTQALSARKAAIMALSDVAGFPAEFSPHDINPVFTDKVPLARPGQTQPQAQQHWLSACDSEATLQLLTTWLSSCGLIPEVIRPMAASMQGCTLHGVRNQPASSTFTARLWLDDHEAFFALGDAAGLRLARAIPLGLETLVDSLLRPIVSRAAQDQPSSAPITLDRAAARSILDRYGIPGPDQIIDARQSLSGRSILPLLSPVLQRLSIEIKQSLRFGLTEEQRAASSLLILGPGAKIPGLQAALAQLCGIEPAAEPAPAGLQSLLTAEAAGLGSTITLLPEALATARMARSLRSYLLAGCACAVLTVGAFGGWSHLSARTASGRIESLQAQIKDFSTKASSLQAVTSRRSLLNQAVDRLDQQAGPQPPVAQAFAAVVTSIPALASVTSFSLNEDNAQPQIVLAGRLPSKDESDFASIMNTWLASLRQSPLVANVTSGGTTRSQEQDKIWYTFDLKIRLVSLPYAQLRTPMIPADAMLKLQESALRKPQSTDVVQGEQP